tara:strand:- start:46 stop:1017 length:972 start_codon:yes stop_codon:yes gene_type:complete
LISALCFAIDEQDYQKIYEIHQAKDKYSLHKFKGVNGHQVSYLKYGKKSGANGAVLFSVGRNESAEKYLEVAYDLAEKNFSPIYITAHRGQGLSDRVLNNPNKGYVRKFSYYTRDLKTLTNIIRKELPPHTRLSLLAHSMGGAIGLDFLQKYPRVFHRAVFTAPMFKILLEESERATLWQTWLACYIPNKPFCTDYVPGGSDPSPTIEDSEVTSSEIRTDFVRYLYEENSRTRLGSSTIRWVRESIKANIRMRSNRNIAKIQTPFLILQASRDSVVDNSGQDEVCEKTDLCQLEVIQDSLHNILSERDVYRDVAMDALVDYLK